MRSQLVPVVLALALWTPEAHGEVGSASNEPAGPSGATPPAALAPESSEKTAEATGMEAPNGPDAPDAQPAEKDIERGESSGGAEAKSEANTTGETPSLPPREDPFPSRAPERDDPREERTSSDGVAFLRNRFRLGLRLGWASTTEQTWGLVGAGVGYYLLDGVEALVDGDAWIGDPALFVVTPGLRYVFHWLPDVKPYLGPLYRHYFRTDGGAETDAIGGRVGVYFMLSRTFYVGGGLFYEHRLDENLFVKRDAVFPEISLAFSF